MAHVLSLVVSLACNDHFHLISLCPMITLRTEARVCCVKRHSVFLTWTHQAFRVCGWYSVFDLVFLSVFCALGCCLLIVVCWSHDLLPVPVYSFAPCFRFVYQFFWKTLTSTYIHLWLRHMTLKLSRKKTRLQKWWNIEYLDWLHLLLCPWRISGIRTSWMDGCRIFTKVMMRTHACSDPKTLLTIVTLKGSEMFSLAHMELFTPLKTSHVSVHLLKAQFEIMN